MGTHGMGTHGFGGITAELRHDNTEQKIFFFQKKKIFFFWRKNIFFFLKKKKIFLFCYSTPNNN